MRVHETDLQGVLLIDPPTQFEDFRGEYIEIYNRRLYQTAGIDCDFVQDDISISRLHVLRGIHGDRETTKLISCLHGAFYLVVVNNIESSAQYRQWQGFTLSDNNRQQVLVPAGFGNGHVVLTDMATFHYKQTTEYDRASQFTMIWNDPTLNIWWPVERPLLSRRDQGADS